MGSDQVKKAISRHIGFYRLKYHGAMTLKELSTEDGSLLESIKLAAGDIQHGVDKAAADSTETRLLQKWHADILDPVELEKESKPRYSKTSTTGAVGLGWAPIVHK